jgi:Protein of unknown function (DUF3891)
MIVQRLSGILRITYQVDHADLAGQFATHWGNTMFACPMPLPALQVASAQHDNGWRRWDLNQRINPATGHPIDFMHMDVREHTNIYREGISKVTATDPYAGLLVSMHGCGLYNSRYGTMDVPGLESYSAQDLPIVKAFIGENEAKQRALKEQLREAGQLQDETFEQQLWANYQLLQIWDRLSLYFCLHDLATAAALILGPAPTDYAGQVTNLQVTPQGSNSVAISPYPFALSPLFFTLIMRDIPDCKYANDSDLRDALHAAVPRVLSFQAMSE